MSARIARLLEEVKSRRRGRKIIARKRFIRRHGTAWGKQKFRYIRSLNLCDEGGINVSAILGNNNPYFSLTTAASLIGVQYGAMGLYFSLVNLPNSSEFTNLYDAYQINKVVITITPYQNTSDGPSTAELFPILHWAVDHDSVVMPASSELGIKALQQYSTYRKQKLLGKDIKITVVPRPARAVYSGAFTSYAEEKANTWIDCQSAAVQHYGLIGVFELFSPNLNINTFQFRMETKYYLTFKASR